MIFTDADEHMKAPKQPQGCYCPVCKKLFTTAINGTYIVPPHDANGQRCSGSGRTVRLLSCGMYGGPEWIQTGERNGTPEKRFGRPSGPEY